ncbi:hypothetical protein B0O99DRAFT_682451 [Bisporella sp. PMI_857]|nr:hypothetical protein B0O99DRAFT_682451 [Bisporella sp. PMI_857]
MDPFTNLPVYIVLDIVKLVPDYTTLENLVEASPCIFSLFEECGFEILEAVGQTSMPPHTQQLIGALVRLQSPGFSSDDFVSFFREFLDTTSRDLISYMTEDLVQTFKYVTKQIKSSSSSQPISTSSPGQKTLSTLANIERLGYYILWGLYERLLKIRPSHLQDSSFTFGLNRHAYNEGWPPGIEYTPIDCGPPSSIEEHRVLRALIRLEIYYHFQQVNQASWPVANCKLLRDIKPREFWWAVHSFELEEMETVLQFFVDEESLQKTERNRLPVLHFTAAQKGWPTTANLMNLSPDNIADLKENVDMPGAGYGPSVRIVTSSASQDSRDLRSLGMSFWSYQRMCALGLKSWPWKVRLPPDNEMRQLCKVQLTSDNLFYTWRSFMTPYRKLDKHEGNVQ